MILLGKTITVTQASNPGLIGLSGTVVEDARDTLRVRTAHGEKTVVKHTITLETEGFIIEGKTLVGTHAARGRK
jgi:RNase P/RNase MRP subunit p29